MSEKASFTPGPWRFTNGDLPRVMASADFGKSICGVHRIGRHKGAVSAEFEANGRLLAEAPLLYGIAQEALLAAEEDRALLLQSEAIWKDGEPDTVSLDEPAQERLAEIDRWIAHIRATLARIEGAP